MKRVIIVLLGIVLLLSAAMLLKSRKQSVKDIPLPTPLTIQVKVVSPTTEYLEQTRPFLALLAAQKTAAISSKLSGQIKEILVRENQVVKEGDLLLQIDDREIVASIKALQVSLKAQKMDLQYAKSLHERNRSLFKSGGLAREKFEASEVFFATKQAALEASRQQLNALDIELSYLNIKAPFAGTVGTIILRKGSLASPGQSLLTINSSGQKLTFRYGPGDITIQTGQEVFVEGEKTGQIVNLYSDAENGLAVAEVRVEKPLAMPNNSYVTINLLTFSGVGCRVPLNALLQKKEGTKVMVYAEGKFISFPVRVVASNKDFALIEPSPTAPVAVAAAAKLSQLPSLGQVLVRRDEAHAE